MNLYLATYTNAAMMPVLDNVQKFALVQASNFNAGHDIANAYGGVGLVCHFAVLYEAGVVNFGAQAAHYLLCRHPPNSVSQPYNMGYLS